MRFLGFDTDTYVEYFGYKSDPNKVDTDGDGYNDKNDPRPNLSDVIISQISGIYDYVPVEYDGVEERYINEIAAPYYGGNQSWFYDNKINNSFDDELIEEGGCGAVAIADLLIYMSLFRKQTLDVVPFDITSSSKFSKPYISYSDYCDFVRYLVNEIQGTNEYQIAWEKGSLGYLPFQLEIMLSIYLKEYDVKVKTRSVRVTSKSRGNLLGDIINQLENDIPVQIMSGGSNAIMNTIDPHKKVNEYHTATDSGNVFSYHWVNVVGVVIDDIKGTTTLEVASWGGKYLIDYDEYYDDSFILGTVNFIDID